MVILGIDPAIRTTGYAVIEGDIAGQIDAETIDKLGIPVVQLDTDGACHIEAESIRHMLPLFPLEELDVLLVENIGNLVCPAEFNIGEAFRVALLSVPEGDDKPLKYPLMFERSDVLLITKIDTLPYFNFDLDDACRRAGRLNPDLRIFPVSAKTGEGMEAWETWLLAEAERGKNHA